MDTTCATFAMLLNTLMPANPLKPGIKTSSKTNQDWGDPLTNDMPSLALQAVFTSIPNGAKSLDRASPKASR
jgi:hypothetical protein